MSSLNNVLALFSFLFPPSSSKKTGAYRRGDLLSSRINHMRARAHTHIHIHKYIHIYIHADIHTYTHATYISYANSKFFTTYINNTYIYNIYYFLEKENRKKNTQHTYTHVQYTCIHTCVRVCDEHTRGNTNCGLIRIEYHRSKKKKKKLTSHNNLLHYRILNIKSIVIQRE